MRYSQLLIPTVKEDPGDAETASHKLMIRAGLMRKVASGTYTYLTLGLRSLLKVIAIVREEMNRAGAQEILVPCLQPIELWQQTGRDIDYGPTIFRLEDRHGRKNVLGPTAEEVVTYLAANEIKSYKQLPINLYQISPKFRDEFRPRFGVIRSREFIMKDAYSFDADVEGLQKSYLAMYNAYCRIFKRCGLEYVIVEAESGEMGGSGSHQFTVPCESGEDTIVYTEDNSYAANLERAAVDPPPKDKGRRTKDEGRGVPPMQEVHTPGVGSIETVCKFLKAQPKDMIKTLVYWEFDPALKDFIEKQKARVEEIERNLSQEKTEFEMASRVASVAEVFEAEDAARHAGAIVETHEADLDNERSLLNFYGYQKIRFMIVVIRGDHAVNPEKLRVNTGKSLELATEDMIEWVTGAKVGFAGPMGIAGKVTKLIIDHAVAAMAVGITGANKTDYHIKNVVPGRDFPLEGDNTYHGLPARDSTARPVLSEVEGMAVVRIADIRYATEGDTHKGKKLLFKKGIEIGQVFKLGTKYSEKLGAKFLDENGVEKPCLMGCYGIGINRILASAIELGNDKNGILWPITIAPFEVLVTCVNQEDPEVAGVAEKIYKQLLGEGIDVLLDDRLERGGVKFKDADLIGIPIQVTVGKKSVAEKSVEIKLRSESQGKKITIEKAAENIIDTVNSLKEKLKT